MEEVEQTARRIAGWPWLATRGPRWLRYTLTPVELLHYGVFDAACGGYPGEALRYRHREFKGDFADLSDWLFDRCYASLAAAGSDVPVGWDGPFERL